MSFRYLTAGESHGKALIGILEGMPSGISISTEYIYTHLKRRKLGYGRGARQKIETDEVEVLSGVRNGKTLGSPICLIINNRDWEAWKTIMQVEESEPSTRREVHIPRPGHADLIGGIKYQHQDMRNVLERSSARETAIRVALGAIARKFLEDLGIRFGSRVVRIGSVSDPEPVSCKVRDLNSVTDQSPVRCVSSKIEQAMLAEIDQMRKLGDTLGGEIELYVEGLPVGLGSYSQWDRRLEGKIAKAIMSLNAIKGVEVGLGFKAASQPGSQVHDVIFPGAESKTLQYQSNFSGGIDGGMSTSQPIVVRAAMKPLSTLMKPLPSVCLNSWEIENAHIERSDVCAVPSAAVIGEYLLALVITEEILLKFGGDSMQEISSRVIDWKNATFIR